MKVILVIAVLFMFSGCEKNINEAKAEVICKHHGGLYNVTIFGGMPINTTCMDGSIFSIETVLRVKGKGVLEEMRR